MAAYEELETGKEIPGSECSEIAVAGEDDGQSFC